MTSKKRSFLAVTVPETDSTMTEARKLAPSLKDFGTDKVFAVYAEKQLSGKGRNGSKWLQAEEELKAKSVEPQSSLDSLENLVKPFAEALEDKPDFLPLTLIIPSQMIKIQYSWLGIATGCAVYDALQKTASHMRSTCLGLPYPPHSPEPFYVKWPNDILYKRYDNTWRKLCGILCETSFQGNQSGNFYIGVGLNLFSAPDIPEAGSFLDWILADVQEKSLAKKEIAKWFKDKSNKNEVMYFFSEALEAEFHQYLFTPRLSQQLRGLALERSFPMGTILKVNKGTRIGGFSGFSSEGGLLLQGSDEAIYSGGVELFSEEHTNGITQNTHPQATLPREEAAYHSSLRNQGGTLRKEENRKKIPHGILALDCGNTRVHWSYKNNLGNVTFGHFLNDDLSPERLDKKPTLLRPLLRAMVQERQGRVKLLYTSVRQENTLENTLEKLEAHLKKSFPEIKIETTPVKLNELLQIANLQGEYSDTLGLDRALRFIFCSQKALKKRKSIATCSAGTALTFECISKKGQILESFIMPGLQMSLDAMATFTEMLPQLRWSVEQIRMNGGPFTTENAMQTGTFLSALGALIVSLKTTQTSDLYVSGGNGKELSERLIDTLPHFYRHPHDRLPKIHFVEHLETTTLMEIEPRYSEILEKRKSARSKATPSPESVGSLPQSAVASSVHKSSIGVNRGLVSARVKEDIVYKPKHQMVDSDFRRIGIRFEEDSFGVGERIDKFMASKYPFHNREVWKDRVLSSEVRVQSDAPQHPKHSGDKELNHVKHTYRLKPYDQVWVYHPEDYEPDSLSDVKVLRDDGDIITFCKPGNLVMHAAGLYSRKTFVNIIKQMGYKDVSAVHRIDRETSGLLLCARNTVTRHILSDAFRKGQMQKMYLCMSKGHRPVPKVFCVDAPIGEPPNSKIRLKYWVGGNNPSPSFTGFVKLGTFEDYSLFACFPKTGRTNQIRIHMASIGHWIVGDKMYHPNEDIFLEFYDKGLTDNVARNILFPRHILHNAAIQAPAEAGVSISLEPAICPLTDELVEYSLLQKLVQATNPEVNLKDPESQNAWIKEIFETYKNKDFSEEMVVEPILMG